MHRLGSAFATTTWGQDLQHLANTLAWVSEPAMLPYMGDPQQATAAAGEAMLQARLAVCLELLAQVLEQGYGPPELTKPMLAWLSFLVWLPE